MYRKYATYLLLCNLIIAVCWCNIKVLQVNRIASTPAFQLRLASLEDEAGRTSFWGKLKEASSGQRVIDYQVLENTRLIILSDEDYQVLLRIVEAEAGSEDEIGKLLVANVVLNRVNNEMFPDSVKEVVFQCSNGTAQFSPTRDGRYEKVTVSEETIEAVNKALNGVDVSKGALYFVARKYVAPEKMAWFDNNLVLLFSYGGHEFFA